MPSKDYTPAIHYSGGCWVKNRHRKTFREVGFPACSEGVRAYKIKTAGRLTDDLDNVTCKMCLRAVEVEEVP